MQQTGKAGTLAQKWADTMTTKYDELSAKEPIFGELRNIMDLAVIAAIIQKEDLCGRAGCALESVWQPEASVAHQEFAAPKFVDTQCSLMKRGKEWVITASGGVDINSWQVASKTVADAKVAAVRAAAKPAAGGSLVWNKK